MDTVQVYDQTGKMLAVLENADQVGYELKHNDLWTASFELPTPDQKNEYCQARNRVRIRDGARDLGLYRIVGMPSGEETEDGGARRYELEHVMATLFDDVLFGYHEVGGSGVYTADVIRYILARQTTPLWQLGRCDFTDQYQYHFENVSLLNALLSLGEVLTEEYTWEFDTDTTPWTINFVRADQSAGCGVHYGRSLVGIEKTMDASALITRLYPLGYGDGVNQLTVSGVNNGLPYIDADTAGTWGTVCSVWTDTRIQDPALLLARARQVLEGYKNPYITYTARAIDLYRITGQSWDDYMPGKKVRVMDSEHGISLDARIVSVAKRDVRGEPGDVEITIANAPRDAAEQINTIADRVGIGELYSQGATNLFAQSFQDNADSSHPAVMRFYVPRGLVRINQLLLSWTLTAFRAYETAAASGGGSTQTSSGGGSVVATTQAQGEFTVTLPSRTSTGAISISGTTSEAGGHIHTVESHNHTVPAHSHGMAHYHSVGAHTHPSGSHTHTIAEHNHSIGSHRHKMNSHTHNIASHTHSVKASGDETYGSGVLTSTGPSPENTEYTTPTCGNTALTTDAASGTTGDSAAFDSGPASSSVTGEQAETVTGYDAPDTDLQGAHTHTFRVENIPIGLTVPALEVDVPAHDHSVSIPSHTHTVTIPSHGHDITYGIYEGGTANGVSIYVDENQVPASSLGRYEVDVSPWMAKDEDGKITRGAWHEIRIVPDGLTRIEAQLYAQCFVQSVGGGDY